MKQTMKTLFKGLLPLLLFLGASCGHEPIGRTFEFDNSKSYALVAYDISFIGDPFPNFTVYFFPYDEKTGTIDFRTRIESGCGFLCSRGNEEVRFQLESIDPGTYIVGYTFYGTDFNKTILCFSEQTLRFRPEAGTVFYIGELTFSMDHPEGVVLDKLEVTTHDVDHVKARLKKYPRVLEINEMYRTDGRLRSNRRTAEPGEIKIAPVDYVAFERGELQRENVCIWDYTT